MIKIQRVSDGLYDACYFSHDPHSDLVINFSFQIRPSSKLFFMGLIGERFVCGHARYSIKKKLSHSIKKAIVQELRRDRRE